MKDAFDKIKERLEEERDNASLERASWKNQQGVLYNRADARNGAFVDALSIVSEVEAECTKKICKWKKICYGKYEIPCCNDTVWDYCYENFKYCPYCGKKIKVVE